jgi:hypothetical protein
MENRRRHVVIPREFIINHLIMNSLSELGEFQFPIRRIFLRYLDEREDEQYKEESSDNPNFMQEKNMNFRLYPFYINWKKIENNESGYFRIFVRYGYLGSAIFSNFKDKYPSLNVNNFMNILAEFIPEKLLKKTNSIFRIEDKEQSIKEFFDKLPKIKDLFDLIEKKIIMMKEVSLLILLLKIYEIKFIINNNSNIMDVLKYEYLLISYLTDDEYNNIYNENFKGKISKIFKKIVDINGKNYILPKTKAKYMNHIKSIFKSYNINN